LHFNLYRIVSLHLTRKPNLSAQPKVKVTLDLENLFKMFNSFMGLILRWQTIALDLNSKNETTFLLIMYLTFSTSILISYVLALLAIAFYTLLERKLLGYYQLRKGPNKVIFIGLPQPFADAIKLFIKEQTKPKIINKTPFLLAPATALALTLLL